MCKELENVIIIDRRAGKIYNLSQIVTPGTCSLETVNRMEETSIALTYMQDLLAAQYFHESAAKAIFALSAYDGGYSKNTSLASLRTMSVIKYRKRSS